MQLSDFSSTVTILVIIVGAGSWGGLTNFLLTKTPKDSWLHFWRCIVAGICAAFTVPLFLQVIQSNLLDKEPPTTLSYLKFAGFCLLAGVGSRAFLDNLAKKALRMSEEAKETAEKAQKNTDAVIDATSEADASLESKSVLTDSNSATGFGGPANNAKLEGEALPPDLTDDMRKPSPTGITAIPREQFRVLKALASQRFTFRTIRGIQAEAQITLEIVQPCLDQLKKQGLANLLLRNDQVLWYATAGGRAILNRTSPGNLQTELS